jgi:hypothetical protein
MFDYRDLLKKYIIHIGKQEGFDFLYPTWSEGDPFSKEEMDELKKLSDEVNTTDFRHFRKS